MVYYLCNRKKCGDKCSYPECKHTSDYAYALNKDITPNIGDIFDEKYSHPYEYLVEKEEREGLKWLP